MGPLSEGPQPESTLSTDCHPTERVSISCLGVQFKIVEANGLGHHIFHCDSGRYLTANAGSSSGDSLIPLILSKNFGSVFVFEQAGEDTVRYASLIGARRHAGLPDTGLYFVASGWPPSQATPSWYQEVSAT